MANSHHLALLSQGVDKWNGWRSQNPEIKNPDLSGTNLRMTEFNGINFKGVNLSNSFLFMSVFQKADFTDSVLTGSMLARCDLSHSNFTNARLDHTELSSAHLRGAILLNTNFTNANLYMTEFTDNDLTQSVLTGAMLRGSYLSKCNLSGKDLTGFDLYGANLSGANMTATNLRDANLSVVSFTETNLLNANLSGANLEFSTLARTNIDGAIFTDSNIYAISAWDLKGTPKDQSNLRITPQGDAAITVDDLQVAQFIYLLLDNTKLRNVIDTITSKVVLILGRFTKDRKTILNAIRDELRKQNFTPILFDFQKPASKDLTGTVETLARMARFIIADITDPSSIPHELASLVPQLRTTPIQIIKLAGTTGYSMIEDYYGSYHWLLKPYAYLNANSLIKSLHDVIAPANEMAEKLRNYQ